MFSLHLLTVQKVCGLKSETSYVLCVVYMLDAMKMRRKITEGVVGFGLQ